MEKIQSAIAKARAARSGQPAPSVGGAAAAAVSGPVSGPVSAIITRDGLLTPDRGGDAQGTAPAASADKTPASARAGAQAAPDPSAVAAAWAELTEFTPRPGVLKRHRIVSYDGGREAAGFDVMRTKLIQQMRANGWRRLAITSPGAECGKSMIALNLGFSLARQPDLRTIVAEVDLRRPSMARTLGIRSVPDFAAVLEGSARFENNALRHGTNLALATNQGAVRNPAELLQGASTKAALARIEARFDPSLIIFDMPPMLVSDDTMAFMGHVDCVLLVAAAESSTIKEIDVCERDLASQTNVLGVVLNKCRYMDRNSNYGYYE